MRRLKVEIRPTAKADLESLLRYLRRQGVSLYTARRYTARITALCRRIGDVPYGGTARDDVEPGLRTIGFERRAVIAYHVCDDRVFITNIFYGGRDYESLLRDAPLTRSEA